VTATIRNMTERGYLVMLSPCSMSRYRGRQTPNLTLIILLLTWRMAAWESRIRVKFASNSQSLR